LKPKRKPAKKAPAKRKSVKRAPVKAAELIHDPVAEREISHEPVVIYCAGCETQQQCLRLIGCRVKMLAAGRAILDREAPKLVFAPGTFAKPRPRRTFWRALCDFLKGKP
jgi:hypothetical protein